MSFQPVIPFGGYSGWSFLKRTMARQQSALQQTPVAQRDEAYFRATIGKVTSASALVEDRRLLRIALTAFGLEGDLANRAFVQKVLDGDLGSSSALANRLADKRYLAMAQSFGFGTGQAQTTTSGFADKILAAYQQRSFEAAIGTQNDSLRLALNAERELTILANGTASANTKWYSIMGNKPLRSVVETAFGLPPGFGQLDLDQQVKTLKSKAQNLFGSPDVSALAQPAMMEKLIRNYLLRAEVGSGAGYSPAQAALQLLGRG